MSESEQNLRTFLKDELKDPLSSEILKKLYDTSFKSIGEIAYITGEPKTTVYRRIIRMKKKGIVEVTPHSIQGRPSSCYLSDKARELLEPVFYPETQVHTLKYLQDMEIVVSAPGVLPLLGFWASDCEILLPIQKKGLCWRGITT